MLKSGLKTWYGFVLLIITLVNPAAAQNFSFEDHLMTYPGLAIDCTPGIVLQADDGHWMAVAQCGQRKIAVVKYNADLQVVPEFGAQGVVTFDSSTGITSTPDFDSPQMPSLSEFIKVTDAKLSPGGELWVAGFNFDVQSYPDAPTARQNFQPWWLKLDSDGVPILHDSGDFLHMQPNDLEGFASYGGGNWFGGLRSHGFVLPLNDGSAISGSVVRNYDADTLRQDIHIHKRTANNELDTSFADNGVLVFEPFNSSQVSNIAYIVGIYAFDEDYFLLATSDLYSYQYGGFTLRKISYQGVVDTSFGDNGILSPPNLISAEQLNNNALPGIQVASLSDIVIFEDWIYLAWQQAPNGEPVAKQNAVARYSLHGQSDTSFAQNGLYTWNAGFYGQADVLNGNPSLVVLDGQLALISSDVIISDGTFVSRSTELRLLTHTGELNTAFGDVGIMTGEWAILDPFQFSGNQSYTPPLNANKSLHALPETRQLAVTYKSSIKSEPYMAVLDVFTNRKPGQNTAQLTYTETDQGWIIDTGITDPDNDDMTVGIINGPDIISVTDVSDTGSVRLFADTLATESQTFSLELTLSDDVNSPVHTTLDITIPASSQETDNGNGDSDSGDGDNGDTSDAVADSGGAMGYAILLLLLINGRRWRKANGEIC